MLDAAGVRFRLLARRPGSFLVPRLPGVEAVLPGDYADPQPESLRGVRILFMISAWQSADRVNQHERFIDAALAAGVEHIVYTSFVHAAPSATYTLSRQHFATEQYLRHKDVAWTFMRDNLFLDILEEWVGSDGVIRGPAEGGRIAAVSRTDVAEVATRILRDPAPHAQNSYDLTGPQALTLFDVAEQIATVRGIPVRYVKETEQEAFASRARFRIPDWQREAWVSTYRAIAGGDLAAISDCVPRLTGHRARTLADVLARR